jgi:phosphoribosylanthranilate isomerase
MTRRTIVKVCGLTSLVDARVAHEAGADWLGFVLFSESPRKVSAETAAAILSSLPETVIGVAVMVSPTPEQALALAKQARVKRIQLHRVDTSRWPLEFPVPVCSAVNVTEEGRVLQPLPHASHLLMLDRADDRLVGGTGRRFPWEVAARLAAARPVLLAGGLDDEGVETALEQVRPFGVDASSRLERTPGVKDPDKVRRFVAAVRRYDERLDSVA